MENISESQEITDEELKKKIALYYHSLVTFAQITI